MSGACYKRPESVLVVITTKEAKLGLVFIELKRRCAELAKVL